jgi:hypothetical protein
MNYLDSFARDMGTESDNRWPLKSLLNNNRFVEILRNYGYTTVAFDASMFEAAFYDSADHFITTAEVRINLFQNALLNSTIIRAFSNADFGQRANQYALHRQKILNAFEHIERIGQSKGRYYVHGHILSPHQPFVFDSSGNPRDPDDYYTIWKPMEDGWDPDVYKRQYAAQLHYINSKLRQLITNIIKESQYPPIIILQGDHGPCAHLLNTKGIEENNFKERMSILNAYYFPDKDYSKLYESISPVNSYRLILSQYFDRPQDLLPDRSYFSTWDKPYQFHEVTKELD